MEPSSDSGLVDLGVCVCVYVYVCALARHETLEPSRIKIEDGTKKIFCQRDSDWLHVGSG